MKFQILALLVILKVVLVQGKQKFLENQFEKSSNLIKIPLKKTSETVQNRNQLLELISEAQQYAKNQETPNYNFIEKRENGQTGKSLKLYNFQNDQYTGELAFSDSSNPFKVIFDTGSSNTWINSVKCKDAGCLNHKQYDGSKSFNYEKVPLTLDVHFGTGELEGNIAQDNVFIAGIEIDKQEFGEIQSENGGIFEASQFDGIVGMGYPSMSAYDMNPVFDNLMKQNKLEKNVFSFYTDSREGQSQSELILGGVDPSYYEGQINYHKVVNKSFWEIKAENILLGGQDVGLCKDGCNLIADTGTSLITAPTQASNILYDKLEVQDTCIGKKDLPEITFVIDGIEYPLDSEHYVLETDTENTHKENYSYSDEAQMLDMGMDSFKSSNLTKDCQLGVMPLDMPVDHKNAWILGNVFLRKYYTVFDRDNDSVGFAKSKMKY